MIVNPVSFGGQLLAGTSRGPHIADYISDLATSHGRTALRERAAGVQGIGWSGPLGPDRSGSQD